MRAFLRRKGGKGLSWEQLVPLTLASGRLAAGAEDRRSSQLTSLAGTTEIAGSVSIMCTPSLDPCGMITVMARSTNLLSIRSQNSMLSIYSQGSILSIGSVGSVLSIGSIGSALSAAPQVG